MELQPAILFIPDISGFTKFVNDEEIQHSTHIIAELLEVILQANELQLEVSEIEGDAILFYRMGQPPSFDSLTQQVEKMYLAFHQHLKFYERDRVCQCGACSTASTLDIKFVCHVGQTILQKVGTHEKLYGPDVTLAHRLLKNDVPYDSYLLMSGFAEDKAIAAHPFWFEKVQQASMQYDNIGEVDFTYFPLEALQEKVPPLPERKAMLGLEDAVSIHVRGVINLPLLETHRYVTDVDKKMEWSVGLKGIEKHDNRMDTIGSRHNCILPFGQLDIGVLDQKVEKGRIEYVESTESLKLFSPLITFVVLERLDEQNTAVEIDMQYKKNNLTRFYLDFPFRAMMKLSLTRSLRNLQQLVLRLSKS